MRDGIPHEAIASGTRQRPQRGPVGDVAAMWELRLFVAGSGAEVRRVHEALGSICREHLPGRHRIALVDILQEPEQADAFDIVAVPTLIRQSPLPVRRVIGDLSLIRKVVLGLGIPVRQEP